MTGHDELLDILVCDLALVVVLLNSIEGFFQDGSKEGESVHHIGLLGRSHHVVCVDFLCKGLLAMNKLVNDVNRCFKKICRLGKIEQSVQNFMMPMVSACAVLAYFQFHYCFMI